MNAIDPTIGRRTATDRRKHVRHTTEFFTQPGKLAHIVDPVERMAAKGLLAASIGMSRELGSDGHIDPEAVLAATGLPPEFGKALITGGAWHQPDHGCRRCPQPREGRVYIHDILEHQRTAEQERRTSELRSGAGSRGGNTRWANHSRPEPAPRRAPGRPRKNPLSAAETAAAAAAPKKRAKQPAVYEPIVLELCEELAEMVRGNGFSVGKVGPAWWKPCEQLLRIGPPNAEQGVTAQNIRDAIRWANNDGFWYEQIRSMQQLREKYEQLRAAAKNPNRPKRGALGAVPRGRASQAPAAIAVTGMAGILAKQMGSAQGGMVKGA
jgi:hypothetical protein